MSQAKPIRILLVTLHPGYSRFFFNVIDRLLNRGHSVHAAFSSVGKKTGGLEAWDQGRRGLTLDLQDFPGRSGPWKYFAEWVRRVHDYVRYLDREYEGADFLRRRIGDLLPPSAKPLTRLPQFPGPVARMIRRAVGALERLIPTEPAVDAYIRDVAPDLILVSPLIDAKDIKQTDVIKSARAAGIPVGLCVGSWDHLTSKGVMHLKPDRVLLWNEVQKREAIRLHDIPARDVVVTGAHPFDMWFDRRPTVSREAFLGRLGLPADRPYVLFAGSSNQINRPEGEIAFVRRWLEALRSSPDPRLRDVGVLIRPHPVNYKHWVADDAPFDDVVIYPRYGPNPVNDDDRADYFHSIHYCAAVVGINTSAMVEATILNKPVLTVLADEFANQQQTLHFRYLLPENGGHLLVAASFEAHAAQLSKVLEQPHLQDAVLGRFVQSFLRPRGREREAVDHVVAEIEALADLAVRPRPAVPFLARPLSRITAGVLARTTAGLAEQDRQRQAKQERRLKAKQRVPAVTVETEQA